MATLTTTQQKAIAAQSAAYAAAKATGDRDKMMAANKAANAIRTAAGVATQASNAELTKTATAAYKPSTTPTTPAATSSKTYGAVIYKADGTVTEGYNSGGQTFYANGQRVEVGDTVKSENGKFYTMTANGGIEQPNFKPTAPVTPPVLENLVPGVTNPNNTAGMMGAAQLAKLYGITTDRGTIEDIYNKATESSFLLQQNQQKRTASQFMDAMFTSGEATKDIVRKSNAAAVATGASRGMQAAQEMTAMLQNTQQNAAGATGVAQEGALLNDKETAARAQNAVLALTAANGAGTSLAGIDMNKYAADTQFGVGALDANARNYAAEQQYAATLAAAKINAEAQTKAAGINAASYNSNGVNTATGSNVQTDFANALKNNPDSAWMILVQAGLFPDAKSAQDYVKNSIKETPKKKPDGTEYITKTITLPVGDGRSGQTRTISVDVPV